MSLPLLGNAVIKDQDNRDEEPTYHYILGGSSTISRVEHSRITPGESIAQKAAIAAIEAEKIEKYRQTSRKVVARESTRNTGENGYIYGYCTWFVKQNTPIAQNGWGNAKNWPVNSSEPQIGGIVKTNESRLGHVALVIGIEPNSITIKEMNAQGWGVVSTRTLSRNYSGILGYIN